VCECVGACELLAYVSAWVRECVSASVSYRLNMVRECVSVSISECVGAWVRECVNK
jgi:hypothetical protein